MDINSSWINRILADDPTTQTFVTKKLQNIILQIYVQPGSANTEIVGIHDERLKIKIAAPPIDDKANKVLCAFLAQQFGVPKSSVTVSKGKLSRNKTIEITHKIN
jgi:uncharacterized protein